MSMSFPTLESLCNRAKMRGFRQPLENEDHSEYRTAFADFMQDVDGLESAEIRLGDIPVDFVREHDPASLLFMMIGHGASRDSIIESIRDLHAKHKGS